MQPLFKEHMSVTISDFQMCILYSNSPRLEDKLSDDTLIFRSLEQSLKIDLTVKWTFLNETVLADIVEISYFDTWKLC